MTEQEKSPWKGGILADEMGMGKTIQTIALLLTDRKKPNLIFAPTVAVMQWKCVLVLFRCPRSMMLMLLCQKRNRGTCRGDEGPRLALQHALERSQVSCLARCGPHGQYLLSLCFTPT